MALFRFLVGTSYSFIWRNSGREEEETDTQAAECSSRQLQASDSQVACHL